MNDEDAQKHLTQLFPRNKYAHFYADYWLDNPNQMNGNLTLHNLISALSKRENLFDISGTESMSVGFKVSVKKTIKNCKTFQISSNEICTFQKEWNNSLKFNTSEEKMRQLLPMLKKSINPAHAIGK